MRGADTDEVDISGGSGLGHRGGETEAPGSNIAGQHLGEAGLVERHPSALQNLDLGRVNIYPDDLVSQFGHAGGVGGT